MRYTDMEDRSSKVYFGLCMLVLIWIGVYWAWEPNQPLKPKITISQPVEQPEIVPEPIVTQPDPLIEEPEASLHPLGLRPEPEPEDNAPKLIPPEFTIHTIKEGEILQDIARRYYKDASKWSAIARANPRVDPLKLRAGRTLRIPVDPNNIQGLVTKPDGPNTPAADKVPETVDYIVQPGDSLSLIAQRFYGSSRHAQFIYESNRDVLRSIDALNIGQTLKLPPLDP
tara:strand:+ start:233237 stop:233917 length:681 start_codon:yes stop_codon:yes gene_type:complete